MGDYVMGLLKIIVHIMLDAIAKNYFSRRTFGIGFDEKIIRFHHAYKNSFA